MDSSAVVALITSLAAVGSAAAASITAAQAGTLAREAEARRASILKAGVAGAILGELEAYRELLEIPKTRANLLQIAETEDEKKLKLILGAFPKLPERHPVFDQCAHQIGILPGDLPREISKLYNMVTGVRLLISNLSGTGMAAAPDTLARDTLRQIVVVLGLGEAIANKVLPQLREVSQSSHRVWGAGLVKR